MKATVPEIAWHNKNPVFSIDISPEINNSFYRAATGGGDSHIVIWHLVVKEVENEATVCVDFAADLERHIKAVNVVRFSHDSKFLASGDDDAVIIIWALKEDQDDCSSNFTNEERNKENWVSIKVLRGHEDDIYDICWSPLSDMLLSGSVDNTAYLWDVSKGQCIEKVGDHSGFVQGVAWDPSNVYITTLCSDRGFRIFDAETRKLVIKVSKTKANNTSGDEDIENEENLMRLFHDDTVSTFFRRLCFSPDGNLIFVPCGIYTENDGDVKPPEDVTYIFLKSNPERPIFHLPSMDEYTVAVRCCPVLFELKDSECNLFTLPYRIVFAIASRKSIVLYDTQHLEPFGAVSDIHYATLTDLSWSPDGSLLLASSSDGYCTIVRFEKDELGTPYCELPETPDVTLASPDVTLENLENTPETPEANSPTIEFSPGSPEANSPTIEFNPGSPEGNPGNPVGNPGSPEGNPGNPVGNPGNPVGNPGSPEGNPGSPEGNPGNPVGNPGSPEGNPGNPEGNPRNPEGNPGNPVGNPRNLEFNPGTLEANPPTLEFNPGTPETNLETREINPVIPEVNPLTLEFNPEIPEANLETPEFNPEIPETNPPQINPETLEVNPETPEVISETTDVIHKTPEVTPDIFDDLGVKPLNQSEKYKRN